MFFIIILILIAVFLANQIRIVPQQTCFVIERLGKYYTEWEAGLHIKTPVIDKMVKKISLKKKYMTSLLRMSLQKIMYQSRLILLFMQAFLTHINTLTELKIQSLVFRILQQQLSEALSERWNWMQHCLQGLKSMEECRLFLMRPQMNGASK